MADRGRFDKLISNLDSPQFRTREAAERELTQAGFKVPRTWLRDALAKAKSDEHASPAWPRPGSREKPDPNEWRLSRAVQVLELAATADAQELLKSWAAADGSALAIEAKAALDRLGRK